MGPATKCGSFHSTVRAYYFLFVSAPIATKDTEGWMTRDDKNSTVSSACDDNWSYKTLELRYNRLDGSLPPEIAMLSKLGKNVIGPKHTFARVVPCSDHHSLG